MKPFRWNLSKAEQLGKLIKGERADFSDEHLEELKRCCSRIMAFSNQSRLVFVGRSPESCFDYLSGVFSNSSLENNFIHLNISNRFRSIKDIKINAFDAYEALKEHFKVLGISPGAILNSKQGICFVDLVAEGGTFEAIYEFLLSYCTDQKQDIQALKSKVQFLGITRRTKNSPNTWRWQQQVAWVKEHQVSQIKNISITWSLWDFLGNWQTKVTKTNPPHRWSDDAILLPPREEAHLKALRRAFDLYTLGCQDKDTFAALLSKERSVKEAWFRTSISELRQQGKS